MKAIKRLMKEANTLSEDGDPPPYISAAPIDEDNPFVWRALLSGAHGSPLEGVAIAVDLTFPPEYPLKPPNAGFITPIPYSMGGSWHNEKGQQVLCLSILRSGTPRRVGRGAGARPSARLVGGHQHFQPPRQPARAPAQRRREPAGRPGVARGGEDSPRLRLRRHPAQGLRADAVVAARQGVRRRRCHRRRRRRRSWRGG